MSEAGARTRAAGVPSAAILAVFALASCAPKPPLLPTTEPGTPYADFAAAYDEATASCRGVRTITASMGMSGRAGGTKLRGRIDAGLEAPGRARLEGVPPFGKPVFVLVADAGKGTLVLTRDDRVLRDAPPDQIVEALVGVPLGPDDMRSILAGCGFADGAPASGVQLNAYSNEWVRLTFAGSQGFLMKRRGAWRFVAATRGPVTVNYADNDSGRPGTVAIRARSEGRLTADIRLELSDVDVNTTLDPRAFDITPDLPAHPIPLTLEELRRAMRGG
jgi:outer membrane lipoprotein-sorting protein